MALNDEQDAIRLCQRNQEEGLDWLIHQYQAQAMRVAYLMISNHADAEDIVQESFVQAWKSIHHFHPQRSFGPWFMRIVVNKTRMYLRSQVRHPASSLNDIAPNEEGAAQLATDPVVYIEQKEVVREILQAMTLLTPLQREAIILHYYERYSSSDIARIVGCRPDAVRRRIHDGLAALERILGQHSSWLKEIYH